MSYHFSGDSREDSRRNEGRQYAALDKANRARVDKEIARQLSVLVRRAQREQIRQEKAKARILTAEQFGKIAQREWRKVWGRLLKP